MQIIIPLIIGLTLGLLGGGGTILAVPALVYVFGFGSKEAIAMSLFIVGVSSLISSGVHIYNKNVSFICTLTFGICGMISSFLCAKFIVPHLSENVQLIIFAVVMLIVSFFMLSDSLISNNADEFLTVRKCFLVVLAGLSVGVVTGLIGVGGGFLIVPSLIFLLGLDMKKAIGSSFLIIAMQSFTAMIPYFQSVLIPFNFLVKFTFLVVLGSLFGIYLSNKIDSKVLKKIFAYILAVLSIFIIIDRFV